MKKMFFKIVVAFVLGASLGFLVGIKKWRTGNDGEQNVSALNGNVRKN